PVVRVEILASSIIVTGVLMQCAPPQSNTPQGNGHPMSTTERLKQLHIALTKDALLEALHNPNAEVRDLAAWQLVEERGRDVIPAIVDAARIEKIPRTRINMAFALAWIGEK